ncbi:MAG: hypothetical protein CMM75_07320 [Rhodospirillaceae bacterium]|jgi:hypothetical protein|nr:hypothetical protein [Rhodospirillaceae bacterium]|tara:strand:- start:135 stop:401 length:267 start_codon:yes stop_codon:yes gene_type:complete
MEQKIKEIRKELITGKFGEIELIEEERENLLFVIRYALSKNFKHRPRKQQHYREDDFSAWAMQVLDHMELTGLRIFKKKAMSERHFRP